MKGQNKSLMIWMLPALFVLALNMPMNAQDDLYYDPSTDSKPLPTFEENNNEPNNVTQRYDGDDDQYYEEEDDYAYEYSSRIRRFHQPAYVNDYYDPFFVDLYHYDPYYLPGASIYTSGYNDYWQWRRWQRWQRWNAWYPPSYGPSWSVGYNPWMGWNVNVGWGGGGGYNPWYNPYVWNNYYYDPYWTWNGYNPYYDNSCGAGFGHYYYNNNNNYNNGGGGNSYQPRTYVGPRRGGTSVNNTQGYARLTNGTGSNGRLVVADSKAPVIAMSPRSTARATLDKEKVMAEEQVERLTPAASSRNPAGTAKDPAATSTRSKTAGQQVENPRPTRESTPGSDVPSNRRPTQQQPTETRAPRTEETRPAPRPPSEATRPARQPAQQETRPARSSGGSNEAARPSRPSSDDRPARSTETRPSRSNDSGSSGRSLDSGSSGRSSSGNSGSSSGSSSGSGSSGSSKSSSGSGSRGRN